MLLSDLLKQDDKTLASLPVSGIACDSRLVNKGNVFVAIKGHRDDGARYVDKALAAGAVAVVCDQDIGAQDVPVFQVTDSRLALAEMAANLYPARPNMIVGITGTNGKTSVAEFLRQIWTKVGWKAASIGTLGARGGQDDRSLGLTTPDTLSLHRVLSDFAHDGTDNIVIEASSHGIMQHRLSGLNINIAGFTNLSRDHLDYHGSFKEYFAAKAALFTRLLADGGIAVINIDNEYGRELLKQIEKREVGIITVGHEAGADFRIMSVSVRSLIMDVTVLHDDKNYTLSLALHGVFQAENAILAAALAHASGLAADSCLLSLPFLKAAPGRMNSIIVPDRNAVVVVDYAHTPDALKLALIALRGESDKKLGVVFGCGGERDTGKRTEMGKIANDHADFVIVTDDNPRGEEASAIRADIIAACPKATEIGNRHEAIRYGISLLGEADILLVAGKGHEDYQLVGDETLPFSDNATIQAIINTLPTEVAS